MIITMSDYKLKTLTRRIEEKLANGYEMVSKVKKISTGNSNYSQSYGGQWDYSAPELRFKWKVAMRKVN